jgi:hypothetical protein
MIIATRDHDDVNHHEQVYFPFHTVYGIDCLHIGQVEATFNHLSMHEQ